MNIVILHGWGQSRDSFNFIVSKLRKKNHNVLALDLPGFGSEPPPKTPWGLSEYSQWVSKNIKYKKDVCIIGHSFGGRIAAKIASDNPKWLKAIVLYAAPAIYRPSVFIQLKIQLYKKIKFILPQKYRRIFYSQDRSAIQDKTMDKVFRNIVNSDLSEELKKINKPTLILWGKRDMVVPYKLGVEMKSYIKESDLEVLPNLGHNFHLTNPDLFFGLVNKFINEVS